MGISYELAEDLQEQVNEISKLMFPHVKLDSVVCLRSFGSSSRGTIARCHALGKAMQLALGRRGFYVIEVISKRFDKLSSEEKTKTLIHELMHIPKSFGGGFIHHNIVHESNVERMYQHYVSLKRRKLISESNNFEDKEIIDDNLTPGQRIEREFFVVLDKPSYQKNDARDGLKSARFLDARESPRSKESGFQDSRHKKDFEIKKKKGWWL